MSKNLKPGVGLDVGTGTLVSSRLNEKGDVVSKKIRDCFLEIKPANKLVQSTLRKGLLKAGKSFFEDGDSIIVLGQDSLEQSVERQTLLQRPMSKGVISPTETKALPMFKTLLKELLGAPLEENERVLFTVPAPPLDGSFDVIYHQAVIESILKDLGYQGKAINEAHAVAFSELEDENYTGICISFGAGQTNIGIINVADLVHKFSIAKGGDYIDYGTATSLGFDPNSRVNDITPNLVTYTKESGVDILNPDNSDRIKLGISAHYKNLFKYVAESIAEEIIRKNNIKFLKPVPIIITGGTSLAKGSVELFNQEFNLIKDKLPFKVSEIRHAKNPMTAVSEGCLLALLADL